MGPEQCLLLGRNKPSPRASFACLKEGLQMTSNKSNEDHTDCLAFDSISWRLLCGLRNCPRTGWESGTYWIMARVRYWGTQQPAAPANDQTVHRVLAEPHIRNSCRTKRRRTRGITSRRTIFCPGISLAKISRECDRIDARAAVNCRNFRYPNLFNLFLAAAL